MSLFSACVVADVTLVVISMAVGANPGKTSVSSTETGSSVVELGAEAVVGALVTGSGGDVEGDCDVTGGKVVAGVCVVVGV